MSKVSRFLAHSNFPFLWPKYENSFWQYCLISFLYIGQRKWALDMQKSSMWMYLKFNFCTFSCIKWNQLFVVLLGTIFRTIWLKFDGKGVFFFIKNTVIRIHSEILWTRQEVDMEVSLSELLLFMYIIATFVKATQQISMVILLSKIKISKNVQIWPEKVLDNTITVYLLNSLSTETQLFTSRPSLLYY